MKRQGSYRMMMVWLGVVVAILMGGGGTAKADFTFGTPTNMGPTINSPQHEGTCFISGDGLEFYFSSVSIWEGGLGNWDIWVSRRADKREGWGIPTNLGPPVNSSQIDFVGSLSHDGLEMYLHSTRTGGHGKTDLYVSSRPSKDAAWTAPVNLGATFNTSSWEEKPVISSDDLELFFLSNRAGVSGGCDIYVSTRLSRSDPWGPPTNLGPTVNSSKDDILIYLSPDGLRSLLVSDRPGGFGGYDTWMSSRPSKDLPWTTPLNLGRPLNTAYADGACSVSPDGLLLYLDDWSAPRPGGFGGSDLWQVPIIPIVDFNGDGLVEIGDLVMLIESWGKAEPLCDIGPTPLGDGKIDAADLEVLMGCWGQEVNDPTLLAHWTLDEASGPIAADSAGTNDGTLLGNPTWQPTGGKIGGALQFDGGPRFVTTKFVRDPAAGPLSVLAWVKGGAPSQTIISQQGGVNWLMVGTPQGALTTGLSAGGRIGKPLASAAVITDGAWHRVAFVWDGSTRILYVDGIEVARDSQTALAASVGGLYIGAGSTLAPGTFWKGLLDDVRIYNRAVKP